MNFQNNPPFFQKSHRPQILRGLLWKCSFSSSKRTWARERGLEVVWWRKKRHHHVRQKISAIFHYDKVYIGPAYIRKGRRMGKFGQRRVVKLNLISICNGFWDNCLMYLIYQNFHITEILWERKLNATNILFPNNLSLYFLSFLHKNHL